MIEGLAPCPTPPDWQLDWDGLNQEETWLQSLIDCQQDVINHGEGDVWTHTRMVCESLIANPASRILPEDERQIVFNAALFHDIAKPMCRKEEDDGHISFRGHSRRGAIETRRILWERGVPLSIREQICSMIRHHLVPFWLIEREDNRRLTLEVAETTRCDHLALLAEADARGRICQDLQRLLDNIALYVEQCRQEGVWSGPYPFESDHARFLYFQRASAAPEYVPYEDFACEVIMMSGIPGVGKDHWIEENGEGWPVISLDGLREEMDIDPSDNQGAIVNRARELAREHLRAKRSFIWNATNLSRQLRGQSIQLFQSYHARIRIVYLEVTPERQREQNRQRAKAVPQKVIDKLLRRWEMPDLTEAHELILYEREA